MMALTHPTLTSPLSRDATIELLITALTVNEWRYARRLATAWLASYPGDLHVDFLHAQALIASDNESLRLQAQSILEKLCEVDPEFTEAHELSLETHQDAGVEARYITKGCLVALEGGQSLPGAKNEILPAWAKHLNEARQVLNVSDISKQPDFDRAEYSVHQALVENPDTPLAALTHLRVALAKASLPTQAIQSLAQIYHTRWQKCVLFTLVLADTLMDTGETASAVALLHQAVASDIAGQVPERLWGANHQYQALWPSGLAIQPSNPYSPQAIPVPAAVTAALGWNRLPAVATSTIAPVDAGAQSNLTAENTQVKASNARQMPITATKIPLISSDKDEEIRPPAPVYPGSTDATTPAPARRKISHSVRESFNAFQAELERIAKELKNPAISHEDGRFPLYVVLTTHNGLEAQYGATGARIIVDELRNLVNAFRGKRVNHENWGALLFIADSPIYNEPFGLKPACHNDPWSIKLTLVDLDEALARRGEKIGAILIVGGPEVVPFHNLPNPVEDMDIEVPSDNPYAVRDNNYFVVEWPIGRVPGGSGNDPGTLVSILRRMSQRHATEKQRLPWYRLWYARLIERLRVKLPRWQRSFGYSAAIWRRASLSVFRTIGDPQKLLISPPVQACEETEIKANHKKQTKCQNYAPACLILPSTQLGYFNLHGVPDSSIWYGQRDPFEPGEGPDFPVAIRPQDIQNGGRAPKIVFTEACYGTHIINKRLDEAMSLKFLSSGSQAVVGSTCISYGSISTPLSAADLLGRVFWSLLEEGYTTGEALRRSKLYLAREMHRRQGYLAAEDQKTLISFVLYGDPLAQPFQTHRVPKFDPRLAEIPKALNTVCERCETGTVPVSPEMIAHVKNIVSHYLPGMADAKLKLKQGHLNSYAPLDCSEHHHATDTFGHCSKGNAVQLVNNQVITLSKSIEQSQHTHRQFARLTLDPAGKLVKLVVSR